MRSEENFLHLLWSIWAQLANLLLLSASMMGDDV